LLPCLPFPHEKPIGPIYSALRIPLSCSPWEHPEWGTTAEGYNFGGYGLFLRTEDIAKFGQLYLQKGKWNGRQLLPEAWVDAATSKQVANEKPPAAGPPTGSRVMANLTAHPAKNTE